MISSSACAITPRARQAGMSLIELMVGMAIGLVMLAALGSFYVSTSKTRTEFSKTGDQVENGRYAIELMVRDIEMSGFYGRPGVPISVTHNLPTACATAKASMGFSTTSGLVVPVGLSGLPVGAAAPTCLPNIAAGSEVLTVRYASSVVTATPVAGEYYVQLSACPTDTVSLVYDTSASAFTLQTKLCVATSPAELRKFVVRSYYIATCDTCTGANADTTPTLKVAEFVGGAITVTSLVDGIQDMHFSYGVDTDNNGSPDCYVSDPSVDNSAACTTNTGYVWTNATTNWANVTGVRVTVLSRNIASTVGWSDTRSYNLGRPTASGPFNDAYKRHVYGALARVWNTGGLRESQ
ncbi:PilW family protein [Dyella subtropica]|uniref:PilW family protein n=1 Tax=Dyella subtropica TaxID=2992127 RepID=UPI0022510C89|nr:PilW family protein [Dyella subtropica]